MMHGEFLTNSSDIGRNVSVYQQKITHHKQKLQGALECAFSFLENGEEQKGLRALLESEDTANQELGMNIFLGRTALNKQTFEQQKVLIDHLYEKFPMILNRIGFLYLKQHIPLVKTYGEDLVVDRTNLFLTILDKCSIDGLFWDYQFSSQEEAFRYLAAYYLLVGTKATYYDLMRNLQEIVEFDAEFEIRLPSRSGRSTGCMFPRALPDDKKLPGTIGHLKKVEVMNLGYRHLKELPEEIGELTRLKELNLSSNALTSLPDGFAKLTNLESIDLQYNEFTHFPTVITTMPWIKTLNLCDNEKMDSIPSSIGNLTNLTDLRFSNCCIKYLPRTLGMLKKIEYLYLDGNQLHRLPEEIGKLQNLRRLSLSGNRLSQLPKSLKELRYLTHLYLDHNVLACIPEELAECIQLQDLTLGSNPLNFKKAVHLPQSLKSLSIDSVGIDTLRQGICELKNLESLSISGNKFKTLPEEILQLSSLTSLYLDHNPLEFLPDSFWTLKNLRYIDIDNTGITQLPEAIKQLSNLEQVVLPNGVRKWQVKQLRERLPNVAFN